MPALLTSTSSRPKRSTGQIARAAARSARGADVGRHVGGLAAGACDPLGERFEAVGATCAEDDLRAARGEQQRRRLADPAAGAGDRDDLALDSDVCR